MIRNKPEQKKTWKEVGKDIGWSVFTYAVTAILGAIAAILGVHPEKIVEKEFHYVLSKGVELPDGEIKGFGWHNDPNAVEETIKRSKFPVFAKTPAGEVATAELPDKVFLWDIAKESIGRYIPTRDQKQVGSCVAFGGILAVEYLQVVQRYAAIKAGIPPPEFKDLSQEYSYGVSRVQIGKGVLRGDDGSTGSWMAEAVNKYGVVARGVYFNKFDLSEYNEATCRKYGDNGPPSELIAEGKLHLVKSYSPIRTTDELQHALASLYPVTVASNIGFGNSSRQWVRDRDGVLQESGSWGHMMCFTGYHKHPTRGLLFAITNSWGISWCRGDKGAGDPPDGTFYVTEKTAQRMLNQGDSWSYSNLDDFKARVLDWFVKVEQGNNFLTLNFLRHYGKTARYNR